MNPRPTTAMLTLPVESSEAVLFINSPSFARCDSSKGAFGDLPGGADILDSLGAGFAFDHDRAGEFQLLQFLKESRPVHLASAGRHFFAPGLGHGCMARILQVYLANPPAQHVQRLDRVAFAI